jgi:hypothetical protein
MNHRDARALLVDLEAGTLEETTGGDLAAHVAECESCRRWLETYRLLGAALRSPDDAETHHPDAELLSLWALDPEELEEPAIRRLEEHLGSCRACRRQAALVREAVHGTRPAGAPVPLPDRTSRRLRVGRGLAAAAALALLALGLATLRPYLSAGLSRGSDEAASAPASAHLRHDADGSERLSDVELDGERVVEARKDMTVANVKITSGAQVTLRAGKSIALGNGFEIASGARATLGTTSTRTKIERGGSEP